MPIVEKMKQIKYLQEEIKSLQKDFSPDFENLSEESRKIEKERQKRLIILANQQWKIDSKIMEYYNMRNLLENLQELEKGLLLINDLSFCDIQKCNMSFIDDVKVSSRF